MVREPLASIAQFYVKTCSNTCVLYILTALKVSMDDVLIKLGVDISHARACSRECFAYGYWSPRDAELKPVITRVVGEILAGIVSIKSVPSIRAGIVCVLIHMEECLNLMQKTLTAFDEESGTASLKRCKETLLVSCDELIYLQSALISDLSVKNMNTVVELLKTISVSLARIQPRL